MFAIIAPCERVRFSNHRCNDEPGGSSFRDTCSDVQTRDREGTLPVLTALDKLAASILSFNFLRHLRFPKLFVRPSPQSRPPGGTLRSRSTCA